MLPSPRDFSQSSPQPDIGHFGAGSPSYLGSSAVLQNVVDDHDRSMTVPTYRNFHIVDTKCPLAVPAEIGPTEASRQNTAFR